MDIQELRQWALEHAVAIDVFGSSDEVIETAERFVHWVQNGSTPEARSPTAEQQEAIAGLKAMGLYHELRLQPDETTEAERERDIADWMREVAQENRRRFEEAMLTDAPEAKHSPHARMSMNAPRPTPPNPTQGAAR